MAFAVTRGRLEVLPVGGNGATPVVLREGVADAVDKPSVSIFGVLGVEGSVQTGPYFSGCGTSVTTFPLMEVGHVHEHEPWGWLSMWLKGGPLRNTWLVLQKHVLPFWAEGPAPPMWAEEQPGVQALPRHPSDRPRQFMWLWLRWRPGGCRSGWGPS